MFNNFRGRRIKECPKIKTRGVGGTVCVAITLLRKKDYSKKETCLKIFHYASVQADGYQEEKIHVNTYAGQVPLYQATN